MCPSSDWAFSTRWFSTTDMSTVTAQAGKTMKFKWGLTQQRICTTVTKSCLSLCAIEAQLWVAMTPSTLTSATSHKPCWQMCMSIFGWRRNSTELFSTRSCPTPSSIVTRCLFWARLLLPKIRFLKWPIRDSVPILSKKWCGLKTHANAPTENHYLCCVCVL